MIEENKIRLHGQRAVYAGREKDHDIRRVGETGELNSGKG